MLEYQFGCLLLHVWRIAARELLRQGGDLVGEIDGFLIDLQLLEHESRGEISRVQFEQVNR